MITLQLHRDQLEWLTDELISAGVREIGGVLVGEHIAEGVFRLADLSVQRFGGTASCFVSQPRQHSEFLESFYKRTGSDFSRFNYMGEWHSHPLFRATPSETDFRQMQELVEDGSGRLFALLLVVRLAAADQFELSAHIFQADLPPTRARVDLVSRNPGDAPKQRSWWKRTFKRRHSIQLAASEEEFVVSDTPNLPINLNESEECDDENTI